MSGIKFFEKNKALFADGSTCVASTNTDDDDLILGVNKYFRWTSIGSDDVTPETLTITLPAAVQISRIFLINHNFKNFTIKYDNGSPTDFTGVTGLDNYSDSKIEETAFERNTAYYAFTPVTTDTIIITANTTQVVDAQKYLTQFVTTEELGTLTGYPDMKGITLDRNDQRAEAISGRMHIQKGYETAKFQLSLKTYPLQSDIDILDDLHDMEDSFLAWLCGADPDQFTLEQRGFRLEDLYQMKIDKAMKNSFDKNVYVLGAMQNYSFIEVVL